MPAAKGHIETHDDFRPALESYVRAALDLIADRGANSPNEAVETMPESIEWTAPTGQRWVRRRRRFAREAELHALPEYAALAQAIESDPELRSVVDHHLAAGGTSMFIDPTEVADDPVRQVLERGESPESGDSEIAAACAYQTARLRSSTVDITLLAVLHGVEFAVTPLRLSEDVALDALSHEELRFCEHQGLSGRRSAPRYGIRFRRALTRAIGDEEVVHETSEEARAFQAEGHAEIAKVLEALRLFQAGDFASPGVFHYSWLQEFPSFSIAFDQRSRFLGGYRLEASQIEPFRHFLDEYRQLPVKNPIGLALRRFALAGEAPRPDDRLVDLVTSAEALFLGGERAELKLRLALRFAMYCEAAGSREHLFVLMKDGYDARSALVHGASTAYQLRVRSAKGEQVYFDTFVAELDGLLRGCFAKAIREVAEANWPPRWEEELLEAWDRSREET